MKKLKAFNLILLTGLFVACSDAENEKPDAMLNDIANSAIANGTGNTDTSENNTRLPKDGHSLGEHQILREPSLPEQIAIFTDLSGSSLVEENWLSKLDATISDKIDSPTKEDPLEIWRWRAENGRSLDRAKRLLSEARASQSQKSRTIVITNNWDMGKLENLYNTEDEEFELSVIRRGTDIRFGNEQNNPITYSWNNGAKHAYIPIKKADLKSFLVKARGERDWNNAITLEITLKLNSATRLSSDHGRVRAKVEKVVLIGASNHILWESQ